MARSVIYRKTAILLAVPEGKLACLSLPVVTRWNASLDLLDGHNGEEEGWSAQETEFAIVHMWYRKEVRMTAPWELKYTSGCLRDKEIW